SLGDADPEGAGDQFIEYEALGSGEAVPGIENNAFLFGFAAAFEVVEDIDPFGGGAVGTAFGRGEKEGDGFGEIAGVIVAFVEEPVGNSGAFGGPGAEIAGFDLTAGAAAGEQGERPDFFLGRGGAEKGGENGDFFAGFVGLVERQV